MIPKDCKRLAEVDFPIAVVSKHSAREKSIRHGHPSTLHLWWARRPLAACRAMLLALLLPDPGDEHCPTDFKEKARALLSQVQGRPGSKDDDLRQALLKFIGDFASWDLSSNQTYLDVSRGLVKLAYPEETPLVVDPFAGGGAIPLEALRLGCDAYASDLNSVACLIEKVMLEDIPRHGPQLVEELRRVGAEIKTAAEKELAEFYPSDPDGAQPIAYIWARTVICEAPNCGAEIPLARSFWLSKKASRMRALRYEVMRPKSKTPYVEFEIFEPKKDNDVSPSTVIRAKAKCLCCGTVLAPERVRAQLAAQRGCADVIFDDQGRRIGGARLLAIVTLKAGESGRSYRLPAERDYRAVHKAQARLAAILDEWGRAGKQGLCPMPDEPLPPVGTLGFRVQRYGMLQWGDIFTARQKIALRSFANATRNHAGDISAPIALTLGKLADLSNSLCGWIPEVECPSAVFKLGRVKMTWDFVESATLQDSSGSYSVSLENLIAGVRSVQIGAARGQVSQQQAQSSALPDDSAAVWFTDPPYYDAIPYSDLSDFFFVWLKRALPGHNLLRDPFDPANPLTPKDAEAVQDDARSTNGRPKDRAFFEEVMAVSFAEGKRILHPDGIGSVVFAHKTTEGWEALLSGMIRGGWTITGSWPISTEMGHRIRARESAALATSVHLVCRPRSDDAMTGDWSEVLRMLPKRVGDWMERLQAEHVRGADLVFACIGPALEIFSRYSRVETADGREVPLAEYLEKVWEVVGRTALEHVLGTAEAKARNGAAGALEEDARLTALFLWTLQSTNGNDASPNGDTSDGEKGDDDDEEPTSGSKKAGYSLIYDVARRFAQPLGIHLDVWKGRIIEIEKGVIRLLPVHERAKQLFGEGGTQSIAEQIERNPSGSQQLGLFPDEEIPKVKARKGGKSKTTVDLSDEAIEGRRHEATTLDRIHAAMLLQAGGRTNALRALLKAEQERGPDFLRLANALSALYPRDSEEKRLLDAMLLAAPR